jgi:hypothetical protein
MVPGVESERDPLLIARKLLKTQAAQNARTGRLLGLRYTRGTLLELPRYYLPQTYSHINPFGRSYCGRHFLEGGWTRTARIRFWYGSLSRPYSAAGGPLDPR